MVGSIGSHLNVLAANMEGNWTSIRALIACVAGITLVGVGLLTKFLLTSRAALKRKVKEERKRPNQLNIEMPAIAHQLPQQLP